MRWMWIACIAWICPWSALAAEPPLRLGESTALTDAGTYGELAWAPDGETLSFTGAGARGLYTVAVAGGTVQEIVAPAALAVFRHRWSDGGTVHVPPRGTAGAQDVVLATGAVRDAGSSPAAWIEGDDLMVGGADGPRLLTRGQDRFFDPVPSPDGARVAFVGLATGIHVAELATGEIRHVGPGTRPCWTPAGDMVLFERTADDGQTLVGAELWAWSVEGDTAFGLTATPDLTERYPAVSPDGTTLAFVRDGAVVVAPLLRTTP